MLTFNECEQLKAAGFPQVEQCDRFWSGPHDDGTGVQFWREHDRIEWNSSAESPNTDELLADIARRWPAEAVKMVAGSCHVVVTLAEKSAFPPLLCVDATPVSAVCALYLKLAELEAQHA